MHCNIYLLLSSFTIVLINHVETKFTNDFFYKDPVKVEINAQNIQINENDSDDIQKDTITCRCNICPDLNFCLTTGACYLISKFNKDGERVHTQGCIDKSVFDDEENPYFCRSNYDFPFGYKRECCFNNLCNGNFTYPYQFQDLYNNENIFLLASVCAVIFLTLIAFILFFSCRFDLR
ncbi:hypothetical protein PVAND_009830 [Polypedilum vanderplanki]|uniref:Activin types I and II receptor domain-containing protein n=1 Tax=Polypedilum vanderplanki TaxID=319348 RepID=A0A9J6CFC3_POLVA|nr:hypothetical protein PVAND_009830 [Polypedilum vanderplanki]